MESEKPILDRVGDLIEKLIMYEAKLKNKYNDHESDWFQRPDKQAAKNAAYTNYKNKYPGDSLTDTEYIIKTLH